MKALEDVEVEEGFDWRELAVNTEGYSCGDVVELCREVRVCAQALVCAFESRCLCMHACGVNGNERVQHGGAGTVDVFIHSTLLRSRIHIRLHASILGMHASLASNACFFGE